MFDDPNVVLHCEKIDKIYPGTKALDQVSFDLLKAKVNVLIGENGAGKSTLMKMIAGIEQPSAGKMYMDGEEVYFRDINDAKAKKMKIGTIADQLNAGFAIVPEDRQRQGLVQSLDICKNASLASLENFAHFCSMDYTAEGKAVDDEIIELHIKVADKHLPILSLSGGNQQKVVIAKGLMTKPEVLLMDEPSRGIDIGAKTEVFEIIHDFSERGLSIIVISSELKEIMAIADRIYVLSNGKCTAELTSSDITEDNLVRASYAGLGTGKHAAA